MIKIAKIFEFVFKQDFIRGFKVRLTYLMLMFRGKKVKLSHFEVLNESIQASVPVLVYFKAENYYKVTLNGVDVTYSAIPYVLLTSSQQEIEIQVFGVDQTITKVKNVKVLENKESPKPQFLPLNIKTMKNGIRLEASVSYRKPSINSFSASKLKFNKLHLPINYDLKSIQYKINFCNDFNDFEFGKVDAIKEN